MSIIHNMYSLICSKIQNNFIILVYQTPLSWQNRLTKQFVNYLKIFRIKFVLLVTKNQLIQNVMNLLKHCIYYSSLDYPTIQLTDRLSDLSCIDEHAHFYELSAISNEDVAQKLIPGFGCYHLHDKVYLYRKRVYKFYKTK